MSKNFHLITSFWFCPNRLWTPARFYFCRIHNTSCPLGHRADIVAQHNGLESRGDKDRTVPCLDFISVTVPVLQLSGYRTEFPVLMSAKALFIPIYAELDFGALHTITTASASGILASGSPTACLYQRMTLQSAKAVDTQVPHPRSHTP